MRYTDEQIEAVNKRIEETAKPAEEANWLEREAAAVHAAWMELPACLRAAIEEEQADEERRRLAKQEKY